MSDRRLRLRNEEIDVSVSADPEELRGRLEPWLSAVLQSEHLSLLLGNGLTTAVANTAGVDAPSMATNPFSGDLAGKIEDDAQASARQLGRGSPNVEDRLRSALALRDGLAVLGDSRGTELDEQIRGALEKLLKAVVTCERELSQAISSGEEEPREAQRLLLSFLLTFSSRASSRERLNLFTTNYDRLVEFGCDLAGLRPIDRFVGALEPMFRSSRLDVDLHYNPPGIRGEPRYLEGVLRIGKIHGSLDWRYRDGSLLRVGLPFGAPEDHPELAPTADEGLMVYPNPAKDVETLLFPYAELMRDMSAAICRPNSAL